MCMFVCGPQMMRSWMEFLDEWDSVLDGWMVCWTGGMGFGIVR